MNESIPRNHEQQTHRPESYRALGRAAAGNVGAFPAIRMDHDAAPTQPIHVPELRQNYPNDRPERTYKLGAAATNVGSEYLRGEHPAQQRMQYRLRQAEEDTGPQPVEIDTGPQPIATEKPSTLPRTDGRISQATWDKYGHIEPYVDKSIAPRRPNQ